MQQPEDKGQNLKELPQVNCRRLRRRVAVLMKPEGGEGVLAKLANTKQFALIPVTGAAASKFIRNKTVLKFDPPQ